MKDRKLFFTISIIFLAIVAVLYIYAFVIPDISGALTPTYIVNNGSVITSYEEECIVIRDEITYFGDYTGTISYYVDESEKTRINTRVADIYASEKHGMYCKKTGFVSYYFDGYEETLSPSRVLEMDPASYLGIEDVSSSKKTESVSKGDFIYKLVDGSAWYLMIPVSEEQLKSFKMGSQLNIILEDGTSFTATSERVIGDETKVVMAKVTSYYPDFAKYRKLKVKVVTNETTGLLIPNTSIAKNEEGKEGVFVLGTDGEYHFTRIKVLIVDGDYSVVKENEFTEYYDDGTNRIISSLDLYDEIKRDAGI